MATLPVVDRPASCLIPSAVSNGLKHFAALKVAAPLALLLFLLGGFATGYAQDGRSAPKPVLHTTVMLPSSAPPSSERTTGPVLSRMAVQPSLSPVSVKLGPATLLSGGGIQVPMIGVEGQTYVIQASTDLVNL